MRSRVGAVAGFVALVAAQGALAEPLLVPGRMGYNALPALRNPDPVIGTDVEIEVTAAAQLSSLEGRDAAATPYLRLTVPFREIAALEIDGPAVELYRISEATQARIEAVRRAGIAPGDVRVGARFLVLAEGRRLPALGVRFVVKSTTGKAVEALRFTNAPGYVMDALAGKDLLAAGGVRLRALAKLGFLAWQVGPGKQDDALDFGATLRASPARGRGPSLALEWRGYAGWIGHDRPMVVGLTAGMPLGRHVEVRTTVDRGVTADAPPLDVRLGMVFSFEGPPFGRTRTRTEPTRPARPLGAEAKPREEPPPAPAASAPAAAPPPSAPLAAGIRAGDDGLPREWVEE